MMFTKNALTHFILFSLLWVTLLAGANFTIDPIQLYRKNSDPFFVQNQRYQIPGLIKNYDFDTVFIGTSHTENYRASYFDKLTNAKSINLAISGSSAWEQSQVVKRSLEEKSLKRIIWEANYKSFSGENQNLISGGKFPDFLYRSGFKTHFFYLFSIDTLWISAKNLMGKGYRDLDTLNSWAALQANKFDGTHLVNHYCSSIKTSNEIKPIPDFNTAIDTYLLPALAANPGVQFDLVIPPMSYLNYVQGNASMRFNAFRKALYEKTQSYSNVSIYDFVTDLHLISEHKNYKDIEHFSEDISNMMLKTIAEGHEKSHTSDINLDIEQFNDFIKRQSNTADLCSTPSQPKDI